MFTQAAWCNFLITLLLAAGTVGSAVSQENPDQEARQLHEQALKLWELGRYQDGIPIEERALALREKTLGTEHPEVAASLTSLGNLYFGAGDYAQAESAHQRSLAIREKVLGPEDQSTARSLVALADVYRVTNSYSKAEPLYQRAFAIYEKVLGAEHVDTTRPLVGLAQLYTDTGEYERARTLFQRALGIRERILGPEHPDTAKVINNLANLYLESGAYSQALPLYQRALAIREKTQGPEHPMTGQALVNLANLYASTGAYIKAETLYKRALAIQEKTLGPEHPNVANCLYNLAHVYKDTGAYLQAEPLLRRAIAIQEANGRSPAALASSLGNLAVLYYDTGRYAQAEPLLQRAIAIAESSQGPEHSWTATILADLGRLYCRTGAFSRAEPLLRRAIAIHEKALGLEHPDTASSLRTLADLYSARGAYARARPLYQRALAIFEKALGPEHPKTAGVLDGLAIVHWARGEPKQALALLQRAQRIQARNSERSLLAGSEARKQAYLQSLVENIYTNVSFSVSAPSRSATLLGLASVLQYKGRVLDAETDSVAQLRRSIEPADQALLEQLAQVANQLSILTYQGADNLTSEQYRRRVTQLQAQQEELEAKLASRSGEFRRQVVPVTIANVSRAIPADAVLVEWFRYTPFDPTKKDLKARKGEPRYVAYVLKRGGDTVVVDIGPAQAVETLVQDFRAALSNPTRSDVKQRAAALSEKILSPLRVHLQSVGQVLMSPDGALNLVPMAALLDEQGEYLAQRVELSYLTSGRDLLRIANASTSTGGAIVVADPDYGKPSGSFAQNNPAIQPMRSPELDRGGLIFRPLANTALEAQDLKRLLELDDASVLLRTQATEANLKRLHSPRILHIASHGFFLSDQRLSEEMSKRLQYGSIPKSLGENPLLRSGIALAGANERHSGENDDGILTALEATQLDLHGTELVVLSACDSGVGEIQNGQGVYGLRRALALAGAQTQITSLWKVSDQATRTLVVDYYSRLLKGQGRSAALRQAQRTMLANPALSHPYYWASLVSIGNWNPLPALHIRE